MIDVIDIRQQWHDDPVGFVRTVLNTEPQDWQKKALEALVQQDQLALKAGHGVGKTTLVVWSLYWWLATRSPGKVVCTAPSVYQLKNILLNELKNYHKAMEDDYKQLFKITSDTVRLTTDPLNCFAALKVAHKNKPETFQGFHSPNMLFLVDDASGVDEVLFEAGMGMMATGKQAKMLLVANPTRGQGTFYNCFHCNRANWLTMQVACQNSSVINDTYISRVTNDYGTDSNAYRVRVLGEFPLAIDDPVIPLPLCEIAQAAPVAFNKKGPIIWGVDVARSGQDKTALAKRQGNHLIEPVQTWQKADLMQVVGLIKHAFDATPKKHQPQAIMIDVIGLGAGVYDRLAQQKLPVYSVTVSKKATNFSLYPRIRDELWFRARDWLQSHKVRLPHDQGLIAELTAPRFHFDSHGRKVVERKKDLRKRGFRSLDRADAFCLTFAHLPT